MRCTALCSSSVICSAGVCGRKVIAAHCEHWRAAVSAEKITRIHVVILFHAPIICCRTLFKLLLNGGKGSVVNDGSVVVFKNYMVGFMNLFLSAVNFFAFVFSLTESTDIKIVLQNFAHGYDTPGGLNFFFILLALCLLTHFLAHSRRWNFFIGKVICNFLVAPAVFIQLKNLADNLGGRLVNLKLHCFVVCHNIAVGDGAYPSALLLTAFNNRLDLFGGVGYGHFVYEKSELNCRPIVVCRIVNVIAY